MRLSLAEWECERKGVRGLGLLGGRWFAPDPTDELHETYETEYDEDSIEGEHEQPFEWREDASVDGHVRVAVDHVEDDEVLDVVEECRSSCEDDAPYKHH